MIDALKQVPDLAAVQRDILDPYCALMDEVKRRQAVIRSILAKQVPLPQIVAFELCYLQLRYICELIALSCLTAHGDIEATQTGKIRKAYAADWIINRLEALHPEFYPTPGRQILDDKGRATNVEQITAGFLTKTDLQSLYIECGELLHRGSMKSILSAKPRVPDFETVDEWNRKVVRPLNHHQIQLIYPTLMIWVGMQGRDDGKVHVNLMEQSMGSANYRPRVVNRRLTDR